MSANPLDIFDEITSRWFKRALGMPTPVQEEAWPAISAGEDTLVSAPTGGGKTLSAFLVFIDRLKTQAREGRLKNELHLIYISPLKSLAGDIRENLRRPLDGISREESESGIASDRSLFNIDVAIRTGDTTTSERRKMIKHPPHILITTPESLYLLLTSESGKKILGTARAIIIDELHALIGSKRGAHLMLSIARLDKLCQNQLQRIGLSATIEPLDKAAEYLSPGGAVIAAPKMRKEIKIAVTSPLPDPWAVQSGSIWPQLASAVYEHCRSARSVIAFTEGRLFAEKLAYYVNMIGGDGFARTHHGSVSKEQRLKVEQALRDGELKLLCATSSMELGIDVGDIDLVLQIGCPRSISSTMQRLGRAGHNPGRISVMHIFPRTASEGLFCGLTAQVARVGGVEHIHSPRMCLDILAQHLVSMAAGEGYVINDVMEILTRAYPFREVTKDDVRDVLCMLAGDYEHERDLPVRPRVLYDRIHDRVEGDAYSRMLAISAGGTIPDRGLYAVKNENGVKLGEVDEEFIFEARAGDKFLLGSFAWKIQSMQKDTVYVSQTSPEGAQPPFYKADWSGRSIQTGMAFGKILRSLCDANEGGTLFEELTALGLDESAAKGAQDYLERQINVSGILPDDRTILLEHFPDATGEHQLMVHSMFGRQVNAPLSLLVQETARHLTNMDFYCFDDDYGFMLVPYGGNPLPEKLLHKIDPESARPILTAALTSTPIFNMAFRYNSARALMMGVRKAKRVPLWVQRLRSAEMLESIARYENHPLIRDTKRECLEDYWDLDGVEHVLKGIRSGAIQVREIFIDAPSPMSLPLRRQAEATILYDYAPTPSSLYRIADEAIEKAHMIEPAPEQLAKMYERARLPKDEKQLHSMLMIEGDLTAGEMDVPISWLELLAKQGRAVYIEPGLWIAAEQSEEYTAALDSTDMDARLHIVRRALRYRGALTPEDVADRYFWPDDVAQGVLDELCIRNSAVESQGCYYHAELYDRARRETIRYRRRQVNTQPPERYAALLAGRIRINAPAVEQLEAAIKSMCDQPHPIAMWESVLFPGRVNGYRPALLDTLLSQGGIFWRINPDTGLSFHYYEDIDWDSDISASSETLEGNEKIVYEALLKRGASFTQGLSALLGGESPYDALLALAGKGLVAADSFVPVRQLLNKDKLGKATARQRVSARVMTLTSGRWEVLRPLKIRDMEQGINRAFDQSVLLCRETSGNLPWSMALEVLRVWEYTGKVRRGYFIEGLSGAQYIREKEYAGVILALDQEQTGDEIVWLPASDPAQIWGKCIQHKTDRQFMNVSGVAVALRTGLPVAVFERQGQVLRVFDMVGADEVFNVFAKDYAQKRLFPDHNRLVVKQYPPEASEPLVKAGFSLQMQDYVIYRGY